MDPTALPSPVAPRPGARSDAAWVAGAMALGLAWFNFLNQVRVEWTLNPQYQFGWGVPFLAAYLLWERWRTRPAVSEEPAPGWLGWTVLICMALLLPLRLVQEANPDWRVVSWTWAVSVIVLTGWYLWSAGGRAWARHFAPPILFVLVAVPWPSGVEVEWVQALTRTIAGATVEALNWMGVPATQRGNLIQLATQVVGVDEACSGVRSLQSVLMAGVFLGELCHLSTPRRAGLVAVGIGMACLLNLARALLLTWVCARQGASALEQWHDPAGWTILAISIAGLWILALRLQPRTDSRLSSAVAGSPGSAAAPPGAALAPRWPGPAVMCGLAGWFIVVEAGTRRWFEAHEAHWVRRGQLEIEWPASSSGFRFEAVPETTRLVLRSDELQAATWMRTDGTFWQLYFARWRPGRISTQVARVHRPELCLPAVGLLLEQDHGPGRMALDGDSLEYERLTFRSNERVLRVFFARWEDRTAPGRIASAARIDAISRLADAWHGRRHPGQQMIEVAIAGPAAMDSAERAFREFVAAHLRLGGRS